MADIHLDNQSKPTTPSSGSSIWFADTTAKIPCFIDDAGRIWARSHNASVAAQGAGFSSDTYVTNSDIVIPSFGLQAKTRVVFRLSIAKTAAGTAAPVYSIRIGSNRSTADTARLALTGPSNTAASDNAYIEIMMTVRNVGASGVLQGTLDTTHDNASTGFATSHGGVGHVTGSGFDNSALGGQYIGLSLDAGASAAWTLSQIQVEANW